MRRIGLVGIVAGGLLLLASPPSFGQGMGGGGGGSGGGSSGFGGSSGGGTGGTGGAGGFGTSSGGGFTGGGFGTSSGGFGTSSGGGFTGGTGGAGGFGTGGTGGFGAGGAGGGFGAAGGSAQFANSSVFGKYLGNPYAAGMAIGRTNSAASQYARPFPVTLSFGTPVYNTATLGRTTTTGSTALGLGGLGGLGATGAAATGVRFAGASSAGMRRAPGYLSEPAFPVPERSRAEEVRPDLQAVVARSERLPSAGNIRVSAEGDTVVLRGRVTSDRERRLAEAMIRLTPGVRDVRNELQTPVRR